MYKYLFVLIMAGLMSCNNATTPKRISQTFDVQGHRGCRGLLPENTIPAMLKAIDLGVNTLEMDIVITADSQCILSHEPFFNHEITTAPAGIAVTKENEQQFNIFKMTYAETTQYDVGTKKHPRFPEQLPQAAHKPLLKDVFDSVKAHCAKTGKPIPFFNIETKSKEKTDHVYHPDPQAFMELVWKQVQAAGLEENTVIQSFDFRTIQVLQKKHPQAKIAALIEGYDTRDIAVIVKDLGFEPTIISPANELVTPKMVADCHQRGMQIIPWTVNEAAGASALISMGIDGIISDYPDRILALPELKK